MKKKVFHQLNVSGTPRPTGLFVRINPKSGAITFSKDLVQKLKITTETGIMFIQDEDRPSDWYIELSSDAKAFRARSKYKNISAIIQSCPMAREILTSCGLEMAGSYKFLVAPEPVDGMYAIITKSAQTKLKQAA